MLFLVILAIQVMDTEVANIQTVLKEMYPAGKVPGLAYVVVCKRISQVSCILTSAVITFLLQRFFKPDQRGKPDNPPSGMVVDDVVTLPQRYDFFLVSQSVRQGTVNPTSYNVLMNSIGPLNPDRMQMITYKLCHLYFNW